MILSHLLSISPPCRRSRSRGRGRIKVGVNKRMAHSAKRIAKKPSMDALRYALCDHSSPLLLIPSRGERKESKKFAY
jgi:hypothetical protein